MKFDRTRRRSLGAAVAVAVLLLLVSAGARGYASRWPPIHLNPNMDDQPKYLPQAESRFFYSGSASQAPVEGTIARGELHEDSVLFTGKSDFGSFVSTPLPVDAALRARGGERFGIYCRPCHGDLADGRGALYRRAKLQTQNLHEDRIKQMPDGQIFDVITNGRGLMQGYRFLVPVRDRWAIVAYVRELQKQELRTGEAR